MRRVVKLSLVPALLLALLLVVLGAGGASSSPGPEGAPGLARAIGIQEKHTDRLLAIGGVVGTAVSDESGAWVVKVFTDAPGVQGIPRKLDDVEVVVQVTGKLRALHHRAGHSGGPGGGGDPPAPPPPPPADGVANGSSTGNQNECSAGTLGAKVVAAGGGVQALSNNHVWARENAASVGEEVMHPGLLDTSCAYDPANRIGTLAAFVPIDFSETASNTVDAAIAAIDPGVTLSGTTPADGYGAPRSQVAAAAVGQNVQKYGRTSGQTNGTVTAVNATVLVGYDKGTARFEDQIIVEARKPFIKAGDSGSLLVDHPGRQAVGLLFAGSQSGKLAVANEIGNVLAALNITIDGE